MPTMKEYSTYNIPNQLIEHTVFVETPVSKDRTQAVFSKICILQYALKHVTCGLGPQLYKIDHTISQDHRLMICDDRIVLHGLQGHLR